MRKIQRILCAVDFSETSLEAFRYADDFADWMGAELVVLHAFSQPATHDPNGQWTPSDPTVLQRLAEFRSNHADVKLRHLAHAGLADEVICWAAEQERCDLIVVGTHGRTGISHLLLGSTAESVMRMAPCPVLAIRPQRTSRLLVEPSVAPMPTPRSI